MLNIYSMQITDNGIAKFNYSILHQLLNLDQRQELQIF